MTASRTEAFDPLDPVQAVDPYPRLAGVRAAGGLSRPRPGLVFLATEAAARAALRETQALSNAGNFELASGPDADPPTVAQLDPPRHLRMRRLLLAGLRPGAIAEKEPLVRSVAGQLVDRMAAAGRADLVAQFAIPLPVTVITDVVGVPPADHDDFVRWTKDISAHLPHDFKGTDSWAEFTRYLRELVSARRRAAARPDDLISRLVDAEIDGSRLTDDEIRMSVFQLIVAGNDPTTHLIGNLLYQLLLEPDRWQRLRADRSLLPVAVEESLRHDSPIEWVMRRCVAPTVVDGAAVAAGERVLVGLGAANRDPAQWSEPDRFRVDRADAREHLAFGHGIHLCLGAPLARLEATVAVETLLDRLPGLRLATGYRYRKVPGVMLRGPGQLPVEW